MTARRRDDFRGEFFSLPFAHGSTTADTPTKLYKVPAGKSLRLTRVGYVNPTGLAVDASNFFNLEIGDGTNVAFSWSTETTVGQGALPANDFVEFAESATKAFLTLGPGEVLTLNLNETGAATLPAGSGVIEGYFV